MITVGTTVLLGGLGGGGGGGVSSGDVTAAINAAIASMVTRGAGVPLTLSSTTIAGDGTDQETALSHGLSLTSNGRYRVDLTITARTVAGALLCTVRLAGHVARYASAGPTWADDVRGTPTLQIEGGVETYFARAGASYAADELPGLAHTAGAITIAAPVIAAQSIHLEARGTIAFLGTTL